MTHNPISKGLKNDCCLLLGGQFVNRDVLGLMCNCYQTSIQCNLTPPRSVVTVKEELERVRLSPIVRVGKPLEHFEADKHSSDLRVAGWLGECFSTRKGERPTLSVLQVEYLAQTLSPIPQQSQSEGRLPQQLPSTKLRAS